MKTFSSLVLLFGMLCASGRFTVTDFGAVGDGETMDTAAIQRAIDKGSEVGGGEVHFPKGRFLSGTVALKSGIRMVLDPGAVLLGSARVKDFPKGALVTATDATNIGIEGGGTIDGQGDRYWVKKGETLEGPAWQHTAQVLYQALPRPSFIQFTRCRSVALRDILLTNSPSWTVHLRHCAGVTAERVVLRNFLYGPNTDGFDINGCQEVALRDCDIIAGDDGIVLKSTEPGRDHPSRRILAERCRIWSSCNGFKIGTETHADFSDITFRDSVVYSSAERPLDRTLAAIAIESVDGSRLDGIYVSNIVISNVKAPIFVRLGHRGGNSEKTRQAEPRVPGVITNVVIQNVRALNCMFESSITGIPGHPVKGIRLEQIQLEYEGGGLAEMALGEVLDETKIRSYPEAQMFGRLPAWGLYLRHVRGIHLRDVRLDVRAPDGRSALVADDVQGIRIHQMQVGSSSGELPLVWFTGVKDAALQGCPAPRGSGIFLAVEGDAENISAVSIAGCDTRLARTPVAKLGRGEILKGLLPCLSESKPGKVLIEARDLKIYAPMVLGEDASLPSGNFIEVPWRGGRDAGGASCRFIIKEGGEYLVRVYAYSPRGESDTFYLKIDEGRTVLSDLPRQGAWYWDLVRDRINDKPVPDSFTTYNLTAGEHVLKLKNREDGTRISRILIMKKTLPFDAEGGP